MTQKSITKAEVSKLNKAVRTLHSFCDSRSTCKGCPFKKESTSIYGKICKFGCFYPELWDGLEIKEDEDH